MPKRWTTKESRKAFFHRVQTLARRLDCNVNAREGRHRDIMVSVSHPSGLKAHFDIEPEDGPLLLSWTLRVPGKIISKTNPFGSINKYHYKKATDIIHGDEERFLRILESRLKQASSCVVDEETES